jgi:hypothetical protein
LETSYIVHRLPPWHLNISKQVAKAPKLHFLDSGLACYLLGIREPEQLRLHPLRGAIFESWVIAEIYKGQVHRGVPPALFHYRETRGLEIDLLIDQGQRFDAIEIKSGATAAPDFFRNLQRFPERLRAASEPRPVVNYVVYGGSESQQRSYARLLPWNAVERILATETE